METSKHQATRLFIVVAIIIAGHTVPAAAESPVNNDTNGIAIKGYDPVAYFTKNRALRGSRELSFRWRDSTWLFTSVAHRDALLIKNPVGEIQTAVDECTLGIERLVGILESLREYSAPRSREEKPIDLEHCIDQAIRLVSCKYRHNVDFAIETCDNTGLITGNEGELSQILVNLLVNGIQAMGERGEIRVRVLNADTRVRIEVEDDGPGVPPEVVPRLFDTFFTTKGETEGTGLGLSISQEIARRHRGDLRYVEREGAGAVFVLELPVAPNRNPDTDQRLDPPEKAADGDRSNGPPHHQERGPH